MKSTFKTILLLTIMCWGVFVSAQEGTSEEKKETRNEVIEEGVNQLIENEKEEFNENLEKGRLTEPSLGMTQTG